jgi:hypothetical protein
MAKFESGVKYIYDQDYTWGKMNEQLESMRFAIKERERMLRTLPTAMVDPETGEMVIPAPRISTTTFKISLKK